MNRSSFYYVGRGSLVRSVGSIVALSLGLDRSLLYFLSCALVWDPAADIGGVSYDGFPSSSRTHGAYS